MSLWVRLATSLHQRLARWFPHEFQMRHGDDLEQAGEDAAEYVWQRFGLMGLLRMLADATVRLAAEYAAETARDAEHALRRLRRAPGFAAVGVLSLAFAVGMCIVFFQQVSTMAGPAPGIGEPETLVGIQGTVSYPDFEQFRKQPDIVHEAAAYIGPTPLTVRVGGPNAERERMFGHLVTPSYFSTLEATPALGRFFDSETEKPGAAMTVVVSHRFWETHLGSDAGALGATIEVNGQEAEVVGVAGAGFRGVNPITPAEIFVPVTVGEAGAPELRDGVMEDPGERRFRAVFRLEEGVKLEQAEPAFQVTHRLLEEARPEEEQRGENKLTLVEAGLRNPISREQRRTVYGVLFFLYGMILAMACANLAVLLLARSGERRKEVAIRLSVGAGRFRIVRELLMESVALALAGGLGGLAMAYALLRATGSFQMQSNVPFELEMHLGWPALAAALGLSLTAGLGFGLAPAIAAVRGDLPTALKDGGQEKLRGFSRFGLRNQFMVFQLSGSLTLLLMTGFIVWGYQQAFNLDPGFETDGIHLVTLDPARDGYDLEQSRDLMERLPERLRALPEVQGVALSMDVPFSQVTLLPNIAVTVPSQDGPNEVYKVARQRVGAGYFDTLGIAVVRGRELGPPDQKSAETEQPIATVLNRAAAERLFGGSDPIGATILEGERSRIVVGVAENIKSGMMMGAPTPTMYSPLTAQSFGGGALQGATVLLRGTLGGSPLEAARREIETLDANLMVFRARSLNDDLDQFNHVLRWSSIMNGSLGVFGLILSVIGLFGVTAHAVARRRKEIGIRVSLGAEPKHVLGLVMRESAALVAVGGVLGFAGAYAMSRAFSATASRLAEVFAIGMDDPMLIVGAPAAWAGLALLACAWPARRSMQVNPVTTLRAE